MTDPAPTPADAITPERRAAAARLPSRIAFLGFGLIGGSIARAVRVAGATAQLVAWTPQGAGPGEGLARGLLDETAKTAAEAVDGADMIVLAGPPLAVLADLDALAGDMSAHLAPGASITDVASTKARILQSANEYGLRFVGGHPMAGRERSGVGAAEGGLFVDRPWVVIPATQATAEDTERVEQLAVATGARPIRLAADEHDAAVAAISHLPLVVAAALVESVAGETMDPATWSRARSLAATGWLDMTRLAKGDPEMGAGILAMNAAAVAERLRAFRGTIDAWIEQLDDPATSAPELREHLEAARDALQRDPAR